MACWTLFPPSRKYFSKRNFGIIPGRHYHGIRSNVLYPMRRYGIGVPLRMQGWSNNKLTDVSVKDGYCGNLHYWRSKRGRGSETFCAYMNKLIRAVAEQAPEAGNP